MYIEKPKPPDTSTTFGDIFMLVVFVVVPVSIALYVIIRHIGFYYNSLHSKPRTKYAKWPSWLSLDNIASFQNDSEFEVSEFRIFRKEYRKETWINKKGKNQEKEKLVILMMRKMLQEVLGVNVDSGIVPDSTCVISIPMKNFKSTSRPGEFTSKHDGYSRFNNFEYQMFGDDRIQATYYKVGGVEYVAGVCIYIEDPYQSIIHYRESIVKKLLSGIEYWSTENIQEDWFEIKKNKKKTLVTKSKYGGIKQWKFQGDQKKFQQISSYQTEAFYFPRTESRNFSVKSCQLKQEIVIIARITGVTMHVEWNHTTRKFGFSRCDSCNEPEDAPPLSYLVAKQILETAS